MRLIENSPIVLDDLVPDQLSKKIESTLLGPSFPWFYAGDVTYGPNPPPGVKDRNFGLVHTYVKEGKEVNSQYFDLVSAVFYLLVARIPRLANYEVTKCRSFMQLPSGQSTPNNKHTDGEYPHVVCLYYVSDSDGETVLYGPNEADGVSAKVKPKRGRVVVFDGKTYHASSNPANDTRTIVNFVLTEQ